MAMGLYEAGWFKTWRMRKLEMGIRKKGHSGLRNGGNKILEVDGPWNFS